MKRLIKRIAMRTLSERTRFNYITTNLETLINESKGQKQSTLKFIKGCIEKDIGGRIYADGERNENDDQVYFTSESTGERITYSAIYGSVLNILTKYVYHISNNEFESAYRYISHLRDKLNHLPEESFTVGKSGVFSSIDSLESFTRRLESL